MRVAINGCGRIGRAFLRRYLAEDAPKFQVVCVNDLMEPNQLAYLLSYDSTHGRMNKAQVPTVQASQLITRHGPIHCYKTPEIPDWSGWDSDVIVECSGVHVRYADAQRHIQSAGQQVLLAAPLLDAEGQIYLDFPEGATGLWPGEALKPDSEIQSSFSCTTQALTTVLAPLFDAGLEISSALVTELHGFTGTQSLLDKPCEDWRRGRSATQSIIPTQSQGIFGSEFHFPQLRHKIAGYSVRVPVCNVAALDLCLHLKQPVTLEDLEITFQQAEQGAYQGVLATTSDPCVSVDFIGRTESAVLALDLCQINDHQLRVFAWYDNEYGYAQRLFETLNGSVG